MERKEIANIIFNMCLDMDFADYAEFSGLEIEDIESTLEEIEESTLYTALETIAMQNANLLDLHKRII